MYAPSRPKLRLGARLIEASRVTVVPAGERWKSTTAEDGVRPCVEGWADAGGIVAALVEAGHEASVEALAADQLVPVLDYPVAV